ncbi:DUF916 domain-containing protein [Actinomadura sp. BRA 177]|uniref:WxL protein peptidoglycan domain-containing protein n=1 Tax=Actinomadura sp. BRA 177 TaxID=2745202 RepID=UPI001595F234|nr:DUF916 domain-containing protein [Actinomadura sp. BRA 177]NVI92795.1 DUF916 domain-containing protein [Actinomadura sp. BRA 177]
MIRGPWPSLRRAAATAAACALALGAAAPPAYAREPAPATGNGSWSVGPVSHGDELSPRPYFAMDAPAGKTVEDAVRITNLTDKPLTFRLYGADAYNTPRDADFALRSATEEQKDVGAWLKLRTGKLKVPPRKARDVPFSVTIPANATPGEHIGGVVALNTAIEGVQRSGGAVIGLRRAVAARIYLRVDGPLTPGLRPDALSVRRSQPLVPYVGDGRGTVRYQVVNTGNQRLSPTARVWATGLFGRTIKEWPLQRIPEVLPGQSTELAVQWDDPPPLEAVTVRVELTAGDGIKVRAQSQYVEVPWFALAALAVAVLFGWFVLPRLIRRWRRRAGLDGGRHTLGRPPEDLVDTSYFDDGARQ